MSSTAHSRFLPRRWNFLDSALPLAIYAISLSAFLFGLFSQWAYDDPFITYRYASNLARGLGFVYNPGERVLSTTTPLFALLLGLMGNLWSDLPKLANLIGAFCLPLGGIFIWDLARTWKTPLVGWAGLLLYPTFSLLLFTLGSETPLYLALCLGAFALYARQQVRWAALLSALAILARPDGLLVPAMLGLEFLVRRRRPIPWAAVLIFFATLLPWFLFSWAYFGALFPATLAAKQHQGAMAVSQQFAAGFFTVLGWYAPHWQYWLEAALALLGLSLLAQRGRPWGILLLWTVLYFTAYTLLKVARYYWYYAPLVPGFFVLVGLGLERLSAFGKRFTSSRLVALVSAALLVFLAATHALDLWQLRLQPDQRVSAYRAVGEWLRQNTPDEATVGALEVGIIGYYARREMVDFAGLIQPEVAKRLISSTYDDAARWAVENYHPEYLVLYAGQFELAIGDYLRQNCRLAQTFSQADFQSSADLQVFDCRR
jgi:hypothetical protein